MNRELYKVLLTQFLTAFADNAALFTVITLVMKGMAVGEWYVPALQASFLVAFVLLAPWVGPFADNRPKATVLWQANIIKGVGVVALLLGLEPLLAYGVVGIGAALYSPAKYGILPELVDEAQLVKANGYIEGSTIIAIISGTMVGAVLANHSITLALITIAVLYAASAAVALMVAKLPPRGQPQGRVVQHFIHSGRALLATPRARFSTLGVSLFWAAATVLRVLLVAWAPVVLLISDTTQIAALSLFIAAGVAVGAFIAPRIIPMAYLRRARLAAYAMGGVIVLLGLTSQPQLARAGLFLAGMAGGLFVVPINAALQEIGHRSVGSGKAVALQNFFENLAMLIATGLYTAALRYGADPVVVMPVLGVVIVVATAIVSWHLPRDTGSVERDVTEVKGME